MDEQEIETWRRSQSRSQPPSSEHSEDSSDSKLERPLDFAEGNDLPATPAGDRRSTHANGTQSIQPSDTELAQANGTQDNQANDVPGHTTLPSEQDDTTAEKPSIDPKESLEPYEWDELEERFLKKMEECQIREKEIEEEFREWIQVSSSIYYDSRTSSCSAIPSHFLHCMAVSVAILSRRLLD